MRRIRAGRVWPLALVVGLAATVVSVVPAHAATTARDISFPQCEGNMPSVAASRFGVIGANNGSTFTTNPCLAAELRWAKKLAEPPGFYANTGDPGPARAHRWPLGQLFPRRCSAANPNSRNCSYDYGYNAAQQSFAAATDAAQSVHHVSRSEARARVANVDWLLDVELLNSWQSLEGEPTLAAQQNDVSAITGEVNALWNAGVGRVGIYSTSYQWDAITGSPARTRGVFRANPVWLAGFNNHADAVAGCGHRSFTGGPVMLTQYLGTDGFDNDVICT